MTSDASKAAENETSTERAFALSVVQQLRDSGYQSVWAGGCVRDRLLGKDPHDYDVATSALPEQVQSVFGKRQTLSVGAAFGVIVVFSPDRRTQIEVATFRRDAEYSDGRHPDSVSFSSDREDAQRRDFTINGLFYDPISAQVIDYVEGEKDLARRVIRAIGNPADRIREDKLRMLRAIRFAATYEFTLDKETLSAVQACAPDLNQVSAERIAGELRRMLSHPTRSLAADLLLESALLFEIVPPLREVLGCAGNPMSNRTAADIKTSNRWQIVRQSLRRLSSTKVIGVGIEDWTATERFVTAMACLLFPIGDAVGEVCHRLKLSKEESNGIEWLVATAPAVADAAARPWPQIQRLLIRPFADQLVVFASSIVHATGQSARGCQLCMESLALPPEELNPPPLLNGDDLVALGMEPGRGFKGILDSVRDGQLTKQITTKADAVSEAMRLAETREDDAHGE